MTNIDIALSDELQEALAKPVCADLKLPKPTIPELKMPNGPIIKPIADFTKGIPEDCSMAFSLIANLPPIMVSIECLMRMLALVEPLISFITALSGNPQTGEPPNPLKVPDAITKLLEAAAKLTGCLDLINPAVLLVFIRDIIALIAKLLRCMVEQLQSILSLITDLSLNLQLARESGDTGLAEALECAMENADLSTEGILSSVESLAAVLSLIKPFLEIAGQEVELPSMDIEGLDTLEETLEVLEAVAVGLEEFAESLGAE